MASPTADALYLWQDTVDEVRARVDAAINALLRRHCEVVPSEMENTDVHDR